MTKMNKIKGNDFEKHLPKLSNTIRHWDEILEWQKYFDLPAEEKKEWPFAQAPEYYDDIKNKILPRF